jgi:hypothetical protein
MRDINKDLTKQIKSSYHRIGVMVGGSFNCYAS